MKDSTSRDKDQQYWKILDSVIRLEVIHGHLRWKVTDLSRTSGVGRPLIYYYFGKSKEAIVDTALKVIGDEFFALNPERVELWRQGNIADSVLKTRELMLKAPHVSEFYFHWRHRNSEIAKYFQRLEKRYQEKLKQLMPKCSPSEIEAIFAVIFGLILLPDLSEESIRMAVERMKLTDL